MAIEITVPRLGWSMEEGTFAGWLKRDGEPVRKGDMLFSLEGDKATQEVESFDEGILRCLPDGPRAGDTVRVGQVLAHLVTADESSPPPPIIPVPHASPRARRRAADLGVDWTRLTGTGKAGRVRERDVLAATPSPRSAPPPPGDLPNFRPHSASSNGW